MPSIRKILALCTFPIGIWYGIGVFFRNFAFASGLRHQESPHVTTIGIGNLACGGTGKTPQAEYLIRLLQETYRVAYLSRGYHRKSKGFVLCDGTPDAQRLGDEAAMIARKFPSILVAVCERRTDGIRHLMALPNAPQVIILDDVYQHQQIKPTVTILLTEYSHPYCHDHILPFGNLREFRSGKDRANIIIVTKTPPTADPISRHNLANELETFPHQKFFYSSIDYQPLQPLYAMPGEGTPAFTHVLLFTGIAHPEQLEQHLAKQATVKTLTFGDHHHYTPADLQRIAHEFENIPDNNKIIVTTEKDAARLQNKRTQELIGHLPVFFQPIATHIHNNENYSFDQMILSAVKENITFFDKLSKAHFLI